MLPFNAAVAQIRTTSLAAGRVPVGQALAPARTEFVTVLVSCCGQVEYTRLCAASLLRHSRPPCALRFLQTDALDGTADYLKGLRGVATEGIEVSSGAGQSGLSDTFSVRGDFLVLLNTAS